ncbi:hypothetical protein [Commensalibacter papalotli (ex Servin-Garciduenas et al. 2014)]|uniref:Outer membrane protein n=1 Tax=Commensalibacter papalotli (ex Servin-Garciduenas et al. 2014) TaxID=1208583 RepID=W7E777_9PROT|nr:hypothetical protein [Commensalibacter papalotli (ex Servin-Garciduenas et al. 2014)]EUK19006.1 hypothetical protein COMX_04630 [Commensalibacter papalotli (ex Servin-Garciduenas et al. 2014)]
MKKISVLLAATFISAPLLFSNQSFAANDHKPVEHPAAASEKPSGTVNMTFHSADVGVGYTWGEGVLKYRGKSYNFRIKGGDIVALGFSKSQASGHVYNLKHLYDFAGNYASASGEATAGVGVGAGNLKNTKNVVIAFDTNTMGGRVAGAPGGFTIKFTDSKLQHAAKAKNKADKKADKAKTTTEDLNEQQLNKISK